MKKPVRKVRRFIKRKGGGKGKSKGKGRYLALDQTSDAQISEVFFGGKTGGKRPTGKGKGRKKNPTGPDGKTMTCTICNSEEHSRAMCARGQSGATAHLCQQSGTFGGFWPVREITAGEPASSSQGSMEHTPIRSLNILEENGVDTTGFSRSRPLWKISQFLKMSKSLNMLFPTCLAWSYHMETHRVSGIRLP